jgi:hypothetical protein
VERILHEERVIEQKSKMIHESVIIRALTLNPLIFYFTSIDPGLVLFFRSSNRLPSGSPSSRDMALARETILTEYLTPAMPFVSPRENTTVFQPLK